MPPTLFAEVSLRPGADPLSQQPCKLHVPVGRLGSRAALTCVFSFLFLLLSCSRSALALEEGMGKASPALGTAALPLLPSPSALTLLCSGVGTRCSGGLSLLYQECEFRAFSRPGEAPKGSRLLRLHSLSKAARPRWRHTAASGKRPGRSLSASTPVPSHSAPCSGAHFSRGCLANLGLGHTHCF